MKQLFVLMSWSLMVIAGTQLSGLAEAKIYISEVLQKQGQPGLSTLISVFSSQETHLRSFHLNGQHVTVAPNQQHLVYLALVKCDTGRSRYDRAFTLADTQGVRQKRLPITRRCQPGHDVERIRWSPDSHRIAVLFKSPQWAGYRDFTLIIYDLKQDKSLYRYVKKCSSSVSDYFYDISWFQDSNRVLLAGAGGIYIVNTERQQIEPISTTSSKAYLTSNDAHVVMLHGMTETQAKGRVAIYEMRNRQYRSIMPLALFPVTELVSPTPQLLLFQTLTGPPATLPMLDLASAKLTLMETPGSFIVPLAVSPRNPRYIACLRGSDAEGLSYGIYELNSHRYRPLKFPAAERPQGKSELLSILLNRIEWFVD
ncbi:MAG: hypothetical protein ETSY2_17900 [Candidatus Entotheonella gemina]|uniref:Dipeptidylpeptidase IV N-terminal domain-containing protein n=1 Tax=Candidatus Entotheonella gemina TaxID=1429439 RepID=W4M8T6_9BACT|nr:MAG: hypothetical protein ETSY2_17900 [Candidatus Entotheonella gemina]